MSDKKRNHLLLIAPVMDLLYIKLNSEYHVHKLYEHEDPFAYLKNEGSQIEAIVTRGDIGVSTEILQLLPEVGLVAVFGVGTDAIDLKYTKQRGIAVAITSGVLTNDVADMALGLMLSGARNLCSGDQFVREGRWRNEAPALGKQVSGKRLGIVGMGNIGQAIARRATAFEMLISYHCPNRKEALPYTWFESLTELASCSDFLIIATAGGVETQNLVNKEVLAAMPKDAWLINISRGSVVDERALISVLQNNDIAGAALDVFNNEPNVAAEFLALSNVVLQPHVGSATNETRRRMSEVVLENVKAYFSDIPLPNPVA